MLPGGSTAKYIEANLKPFIDFSMYLIVLFAEHFWGHAFFKSFSLSRCPIFVSAANIKRRPSSSFVISGEPLKCTAPCSTQSTDLENTSALRMLPTMFPRWGTLLTYGSAEVIKIFCWPSLGRILYSEAIIRSLMGHGERQYRVMNIRT